MEGNRVASTVQFGWLAAVSTGCHPLGVYIHVPFCASKCPYCNFYSHPMDTAAADGYVDALCRALAQHPWGRRAVDTVYFGGGTPCLLGADRLCRLLAAVNNAFPLAQDAEITLEANPAALDAADLTALRQGGFNRVSFGVQSLRDSELRALGRRHTARQAREALCTAHAAGFDNLSLDLMLGVPGQTRETLAGTLREAAELPVTHISAYLLKVEPGTPFYKKYGAPGGGDEELSAALYLQTVRSLGERGFAQYEISNFAKDGAHSRHNLKYWALDPYLGLGPSAHSFLGGRRFYFPSDTDAFVAAENPLALAVDDGPGGGWEEYAMLRLRLCRGLNVRELGRRYALDTAPLLRRARDLAAHGLTQVDPHEVVSLTPEGFLLSTSVTAKLLYG